MSSVKVSALTEITSTTGSEELLINDGGTSKKIQVSNLPDTDTTYSNFAGTTAGLVPTSTTGDDTKFLRADGTWVVPTDTDTNTNQLTTFTVSATTDTTPTTISQGDDLLFTAGTGITCETTADGTVTISNTVTDTGITDVVDDTTPSLGGSLDVNGNSIVSVTNGDIAITPHGTGDVVLDGLKYPQADGTAGYVLKTDGSAQLSWVAQTTDTDTTYTAGDGLDLSTTQFSLDLKASGGLKITSTELEVDFGTTATTAAQGNHTHSGYDAAGTAVAMAIALGG